MTNYSYRKKAQGHDEYLEMKNELYWDYELK